jgi:hypothetical protein
LNLAALFIAALQRAGAPSADGFGPHPWRRGQPALFFASWFFEQITPTANRDTQLPLSRRSAPVAAFHDLLLLPTRFYPLGAAPLGADRSQRGSARTGLH